MGHTAPSDSRYKSIDQTRTVLPELGEDIPGMMSVSDAKV